MEEVLREEIEMNKFEKAQFARKEVRNMTPRPYHGGGGTDEEREEILRNLILKELEITEEEE
jgi:hypothetical protein